MSYEAWGEPDDPAFTIDELLERGWISPDEVSKAAIDVLNERGRQLDIEKFTDDGDDLYVNGELAQAASHYAVHSVVLAKLKAQGLAAEKVEQAAKLAGMPGAWPWDPQWWKPGDQRRNLVKAAALLLAEIDRIDRAEARGS